MLKKSFAIIAIASLATSSFANPPLMNKIFMQNHKTKTSSIVSHNNSSFKFTGIWAGTCNVDGNSNNQQIKIQMIESDGGLTIVNVTSEGEYRFAYPFDTVKTENHSDSGWYDYNHSLLTRVNENTLKFNGAGVYGNQPPVSGDDATFVSEVYGSIMTVDGNQLTVTTKGTSFEDDTTDTLEEKCTFKRIG